MRPSILPAIGLLLATAIGVSGMLLRSRLASSRAATAAAEPSALAQPPPSSPPPWARSPEGPSPRPLPASPAPDEATLMDRLRSARSDPGLAIALADEGDRRFPESAGAAERASARIHALAEQGRATQARGEAESVVNRYPDSSWVREIEAFTGAHRHRNIRVTADGSLEYY